MTSSTVVVEEAVEEVIDNEIVEEVVSVELTETVVVEEIDGELLIEDVVEESVTVTEVVADSPRSVEPDAITEPIDLPEK